MGCLVEAEGRRGVEVVEKQPDTGVAGDGSPFCADVPCSELGIDPGNVARRDAMVEKPSHRGDPGGTGPYHGPSELSHFLPLSCKIVNVEELLDWTSLAAVIIFAQRPL